MMDVLKHRETLRWKTHMAEMVSDKFQFIAEFRKCMPHVNIKCVAQVDFQ